MMTSENSILGNQQVVMSRADLDALVEKMVSSMAANRFAVEDKGIHGNNSVCPVVYEHLKKLNNIIFSIKKHKNDA